MDEVIIKVHLNMVDESIKKKICNLITDTNIEDFEVKIVPL